MIAFLVISWRPWIWVSQTLRHLREGKKCLVPSNFLESLTSWCVDHLICICYVSPSQEISFTTGDFFGTEGSIDGQSFVSDDKDILADSETSTSRLVSYDRYKDPWLDFIPVFYDAPNWKYHELGFSNKHSIYPAISAAITCGKILYSAGTACLVAWNWSARFPSNTLTLTSVYGILSIEPHTSTILASWTTLLLY